MKDKIVGFKRQMAPRREALKRAFEDVRDHVRRRADAVKAEQAAGRGVVPELDYKSIAEGSVPEATRQAIRRSGCAVIRGVFPAAQAAAWFDDVGEYLDANRYDEAEVAKRSLDKYFSQLKAGKPQIFNVYWSKPQVMARQDQKLAETRRFLDLLWNYEGVFDPNTQCAYADRVRRRQPGDTTLGLSPHMDAGTVERWIDPGYQKVYERVFAGDWRGYDPFDGTHRLDTQEIPSPAVCSMFRTYQGWTALTRQGPRDGTLQLIPIAEGISYVLLRALQEDVPEDDLCGAAPGRALGVSRNGTPTSWRRRSPFPRCSPATRSGGTPTSAMPWPTSTRARNSPVSSISARRRTARRTAPTCRGRGRPSSMAARRPISRHGFRGRLQGPRHGRRSDRARPSADGFLGPKESSTSLMLKAGLEARTKVVPAPSRRPLRASSG